MNTTTHLLWSRGLTGEGQANFLPAVDRVPHLPRDRSSVYRGQLTITVLGG
jgi:hypothetical protein